jgi:non-heme chloroperoxidase
MATITTADGTKIFYKDLGSKDAQPVVFHPGWPLSSDDWDNQILFFLAQGYRVIAHDRRGHGRSSQSDVGNEMDTYASDVAALTKALDLKRAIHVGHSTGGGELARYVARAEAGLWPRRFWSARFRRSWCARKQCERVAARGVRRLSRIARGQPR